MIRLFNPSDSVKDREQANPMHVNPLKPKIVMVANEESGEMVPKEESMSWVDAAKVSAILTIGLIFTLFMPRRTLPTNKEESIKYAYELFIFAGSAFFTNFIALAGLSKITNSK